MATLLKHIYSQEFIEKLSISLQDESKNFKKDEFIKADSYKRLGKILNSKTKNATYLKNFKSFFTIFSIKEQIEILIRRVKKRFQSFGSYDFSRFC